MQHFVAKTRQEFRRAYVKERKSLATSATLNLNKPYKKMLVSVGQRGEAGMWTQRRQDQNNIIDSRTDDRIQTAAFAFQFSLIGQFLPNRFGVRVGWRDRGNTRRLA